MEKPHECEYKELVEQLLSRIASLEKLVSEQAARIESLEAELAKYKGPKKDSSNSSIPPSKDENRRPYPKREASGKRPGGQAGHKGHSHELSEHPDTIIDCPLPNACPRCGSPDIKTLETDLPVAQVVDIPEIKPIVTEYRRKAACCRSCQKHFHSPFPEGIHGPVQIGQQARTLAVYFKTMHALSNDRVVSLFSNVLGLNISQGWVEQTLTEEAEAMQESYQHILNGVRRSKVGGSDETGIRINGKRCWVWVFQCAGWVYFKTAFSRAFKVIEDTLGETFNGTHVSDRYGGQLKLESNYKQFCLAHIVRVCRYFEEQVQCQFAIQLKTVLGEAMAFRRDEGATYDPKTRQDTIRYIEKKLAACFSKPPPEKPTEKEKEDLYQKSRAMFKTLKDKQDCLLRFLHDPDVPPTNNNSERPLRHVALFRKVFGGFRTLEGAQRYDVFLSLIQSAKRQGVNVLHVLQGKVPLAHA